MKKPVVVVAGASGFVGEALTRELAFTHDVIALSRKSRVTSDGIDWRSCDLFSLKNTEAAVRGADIAVYLVHSMMPQARLVQGDFADFDVMIADNFARACQTVGVKRIVYLGGIIPQGVLSPHLSSRKEVEMVLSSYDVPVTVVRAGLIVGASGSSFLMMVRLVERLPLMICPAWTTTLGQPTGLRDAVNVVTRVVNDPSPPSGAWDIGGPDQLSYIDMMRIVGDKIGKRCRCIPVPFLSVGFSKLWVSVVTGFPGQLVRPLVQSLKTPMLVGPQNLYSHYAMDPKGFSECVSESLSSTLGRPRKAETYQDSLVCSMQRLELPRGRSVSWISSEYGLWVVRFLFPLIKVETAASGDFDFTVRLFIVFGPKFHLLRLHYDPARSSDTRRLFYIKGGALVHHDTPASARLEFRALPDGKHIMAALFNFRPALPWWIYKFSQALVHLWVMRNFAKHLKSQHVASAQS